MIQPLVKWAGGKRQLRSELVARLPRKWGIYYEPFVGGGALFAELSNLGLLRKAVIGDLNRELMNLYTVVRDNPATLIRELTGAGFANSTSVFEERREEFNSLRMTRGRNVRRAALLVYLNKHSYNGLWRVNSRGKYNVPFGRHACPAMPSPDALYRFSEILRNVIIVNADFARIVRTARQGDFVYFDPPYYPLSKTAQFTGYNPEGFTPSDQGRLADTVKKLTGKGVLVMLSNSKVPEIEALYEGLRIDTVRAMRSINCYGDRRSGTKEIVVRNY